MGGLTGSIGGRAYNCYASGAVSGDSFVGGFAGSGSHYGYVTENCYWDVEATGQEESTGGTGLATEEMQRISTYIDAGWDFVGEDVNGVADVWRMCLDGIDYPKLSWEYSVSGDFACADGVGFDDLVYLCQRWLMERDLVGAADANADGAADMEDFAVMARGWGE